jgi:hydroxymethylpyrimidine/phosphomethylpyrimidine kinase
MGCNNCSQTVLTTVKSATDRFKHATATALTADRPERSTRTHKTDTSESRERVSTVVVNMKCVQIKHGSRESVRFDAVN